MLARFGNGPCCVVATASITANAHTCEKAVSTNVFARRAPYPPAKSDTPHKNTAATEQTAGANCAPEDTPVEGNTTAKAPSWHEASLTPCHPERSASESEATRRTQSRDPAFPPDG